MTPTPPQQPLAIETTLKRSPRERCPACDGAQHHWLRRLADDRYGMPDEFDVMACESCGARFLSPYITGDSMADLYGEYYATQHAPPASVRGKGFKQSLRFAIRHSWLWHFVTAGQDVSAYVSRGEDVLDVGCGFGTNAVSIQHRGANWHGLDVDPKVVEFLHHNGLECDQGLLEAYAARTDKKFDKILLSQLIEHTPEPVEFLRAACDLLKPNGRVVLSCPNGQSRFQEKFGDRWLHWHVPYHVTHFTPRALEEAAQRAGLRVAWCKQRTPPSWFLAQRMFKPTPRGQKNTTYDTALRPLQWFIWAPLLRLSDLIHGGRGDAIVAALAKKDDG